jgi:hypothetical protein
MFGACPQCFMAMSLPRAFAAAMTGAVKLVIWGCNTHLSQLWTHRSNGEYVLQLNGLCLTDPNGSSVNGTQVQIRACQNFADQHWTLPGK